MHENGIQTIKIKTEVETEHMKLMERFGRDAEAATRSSMPAVTNDGVSSRRERVLSHKRWRGEERSVKDGEEVEEEEDCMVLSQMTSSSGIRRRYRRKQDQALMVIGGVRIPRKARSALAKGSHGNSSAGNDGVVKGQILQKEKVEFEARKKMKPNGSDIRVPKLSKMSSDSVEEGIENEIAEALFGLMKQSESSKDGEGVKSSMSNLEDENKDRYSDRKDQKISTSEQESSCASVPELKNEAEVESNQQPKEEASMPNWEPKSEGVSGSIELQQEEAKPFVEEAVGEDVPQLESKRGDKFEFDLMAPPPPPLMEILASDNVATSVVETLQEKKIEVISQKLKESRSHDDGTKLHQQAKGIIHRLDWRSRLSATTLQSGGAPLSQRPKRCASHHYIACNIYLHQKKATKTNSLSPLAACPAPIRGTKQDIVIGNESPGSLTYHCAEEPEYESSEAINIEASKRKKLVAQQSPSQPASAGTIMHGSTFQFSFGKNYATLAATSNPSGLQHKELTNNASHSFSHSALPPVAAANLGGPSVTFQERPHSFPVTTPSGTTLTFQGGNSTQAVPLVNGHPYPKLHHQQPHPQSHNQVRSSHQKNTAMSTDPSSSSSSSSHRQLESQQLQKTQFISMQSWQSQKKHATQPLQPCKLENDINEGQTASSSHSQHSVYGYGQNYAVPFQPVNFTMMPYATLSNGSSGNRIEQSQQQDFKGTFGMSFGSISGNKSTGTFLSFSSVPQKPTMHHNLPTTQGVHQKHHQVSERKTESVSNNPDHSKTLVFDNSPSNLNFTASNLHQQRLYRFELQQQQRQARSKAPNTTHVFPQALLQCNTSIQSPNDSRRTSVSQVPVTKSTVNSFLQQQGRASQDQTHIFWR